MQYINETPREVVYGVHIAHAYPHMSVHLSMTSCNCLSPNDVFDYMLLMYFNDLGEFELVEEVANCILPEQEESDCALYEYERAMGLAARVVEGMKGASVYLFPILDMYIPKGIKDTHAWSVSSVNRFWLNILFVEEAIF